MKVLVSACIMGKNCKYNGGNNRNPAAIAFLKDKEIVEICPEMLAQLGCPRPCAEIVNGVVMDENGKNVDAAFRRAVEEAVRQAEKEDVDLAVLQSRSPTCGVNQIYDGSFSGRLIPGQGLFARALLEKGIPVTDVEDIEKTALEYR